MTARNRLRTSAGRHVPPWRLIDLGLAARAMPLVTGPGVRPERGLP